MKNPLSHSKDPDIRGSWTAMRRAARAARKLSIQLGTPFYVIKEGKVVDLNRALKKKVAHGARKNAARKRAG